MNRKNGQQSSHGSPPANGRLSLQSIDNGPPLQIWFLFVCDRVKEIENYLTYLQSSNGLCKYHHGKKLWLIEFSQLEPLQAFIASKMPHFKIEELPRFLIQGLKAYSDRIQKIQSNMNGNVDMNIEPILLEQLLPFQIEGIKFAIDRGGKALIGDEMGCGKTLQAIGILQHYRQYWPALIIVPVTLMTQWHTELLKYCGGFVNEDEISLFRKSSETVTGRICIVPYTIFEKLVDGKKINKEQFGVVIADESHNIKSKEALKTIYVQPFLKQAMVSICLSGTPALNRPVELFTQLHALLPKVFSSYEDFVRRYCDAKAAKYGPGLDVKGSSNEAELKCLLEGLVMIRRLKNDVLSTLPVKMRKVIQVDVDADKVADIKAIQKQFQNLENQQLRATDNSVREQLSRERDSLLMQYYKVTGMAKISSIKKNILYYIKEARERKKPEKGMPIEEDEGEKNKAVIMELEKDIIIIDDEEKLDDNGKHEVVNLLSPQKETEEAIEIDEDAEVLYDTDEEQEKRQSSGSSYTPTKRLRKKARINYLQEEESNETSGSVIDLLDEVEEELPGGNYERKNHNNIRKKHKNLDSFVIKSPKNKTNKKKSGCISQKSTENDSDPVPLGQKILVFAHHQVVLDAIESLMREEHIRYIRVDGSTTSARKGEYLKKFQTDNTVDVALLSITSCGTGLNLTVANLAIFAEMYWTPGIVLQAEDRIHRIGQKSDEVRIIYLLAKNTADDMVWDLIQKKYSTLEATIGTGEKCGRLQVTYTTNEAMASEHHNSSSSHPSFRSQTINSKLQQQPMDHYLANKDHEVFNSSKIESAKSNPPYQHSSSSGQHQSENRHFPNHYLASTAVNYPNQWSTSAAHQNSYLLPSYSMHVQSFSHSAVASNDEVNASASTNSLTHFLPNFQSSGITNNGQYASTSSTSGEMHPPSNYNSSSTHSFHTTTHPISSYHHSTASADLQPSHFQQPTEFSATSKQNLIYCLNYANGANGNSLSASMNPAPNPNFNITPGHHPSSNASMNLHSAGNPNSQQQIVGEKKQHSEACSSVHIAGDRAPNGTSSNNALTADQLARIEANRLAAMARREAKKRQEDVNKFGTQQTANHALDLSYSSYA